MSPKLRELALRLAQGDESAKAELLQMVGEGDEDARAIMAFSVSPSSAAAGEQRVASERDWISSQHARRDSISARPQAMADPLSTILEMIQPAGQAIRGAADPVMNLVMELLTGSSPIQASSMGTWDEAKERKAMLANPAILQSLFRGRGQPMGQASTAVGMGGEPSLDDLLAAITGTEESLMGLQAPHMSLSGQSQPPSAAGQDSIAVLMQVLGELYEQQATQGSAIERFVNIHRP